MWQRRIVSALVLTSFCLAAAQQPAPEDDKGLESLIDSVFGPDPAAENNKNPVNTGHRDDSANKFNNQNSNGGTILGSSNTTPGPAKDCECVPYYQCHNGTIVPDGTGLIDIRSALDDYQENIHLSSPFSGPCENYLDVCCKSADIVPPEEKITPTPLVRRGCGQRNPNGVGFRITGDKNNEAQFGEFPAMVAILKEETVDRQKGQVLNVYQCGGSLIHPQAVLTAAHCVSGKLPSQLKIRAGEWDTQTKSEIFPHQDRNVSQVIVHSDYHAGSLRYDFAVLILETPVVLAENVDVVCLPEDGQSQIDGTRCFASGWGRDQFGQAGRYQVILKKLELPIVNRNTCQSSLRTTRLGKHFVLNESFLCAGGERGKDTCQGDGGSPLVCPLVNDPTRYVQAGIVAWGIGCGENGIPGVYADVGKVRAWIDEQVAYNNLDTNVYTY